MFPARQGVTDPACAREGRRQCRPKQRRQAVAVPALPRLRTAPSRSRGVWSALACWRFRGTALLPETSCPACILQACSTSDPISGSPDDLYPPRAGLHPGPGRLNPHRQHRPENSEASPAELLALRPARWPVAGRTPKPASKSVGSPQKAGIPFLNKASHSRDLCWSEPRERCGR